MTGARPDERGAFTAAAVVFVAALFLLLFLVDVASADVVTMTQLYPAALLPLYGIRSRAWPWSIP